LKIEIQNEPHERNKNKETSIKEAKRMKPSKIDMKRCTKYEARNKKKLNTSKTKKTQTWRRIKMNKNVSRMTETKSQTGFKQN
jgi:hypothetical protein